MCPNQLYMKLFPMFVYSSQNLLIAILKSLEVEGCNFQSWLGKFLKSIAYNMSNLMYILIKFQVWIYSVQKVRARRIKISNFFVARRLPLTWRFFRHTNPRSEMYWSCTNARKWATVFHYSFQWWLPLALNNRLVKYIL